MDSKDYYRKRRLQLAKQMEFPVCFFGWDFPLTANNCWLQKEERLYQEPTFLYLTGINQLKVALFLYWDAGALLEVLFLPAVDTKKMFWEGYSFGIHKDTHANEANLEKLENITGFKEYRLIETLPAFVEEYFRGKEKQSLGFFWHQSSRGKIIPDGNYRSMARLKKSLAKHHSGPITYAYHNVAPTVWKERLVLDAVAVKHAKLANQWSSEAFVSMLACHRDDPFDNEYAIALCLEGKLQEKSVMGLSFPTIVAAGENACTLHYTKNDDAIGDGELVLVDFGIRCQSMLSDITRVFPIGGRFNPLQKLLYSLVLEAQNLVERIAKPGVTIDNLDKQVTHFMDESLKSQITDRGGKVELAYDIRPHSVSHLIGLQVHDGDPFGKYKSEPLRAGYFISNEPGLYGQFELTIDGRHYCEHVGIRLEDDLLITSEGTQNLTKNCPKHITAIEKMLA